MTNHFERGNILLALARAAIAREFGQKNLSVYDDAWLHEFGACFVTLHQHGELRGCIGSLEPRRTLLDDIEGNARAAAFSDQRFTPLTAAELDTIAIEVSLLSPLKTLQYSDEADALAQLRPGIDGVVLECGYQRATFLPQVWEQLPTPREFLTHLKVKAGLSANFWANDLILQRYTVTKFSESDD